MNTAQRYFIVYLTFVLLVVIDLITKILTDGIDNVTIINGVISFNSAYNKGAAWSIFSHHTIILALLSIIFVIFAVIFDYKTKIKKNKLYNISFVLILSGAFGNAIDRTFLGYVRDFIRLDFINFPIFNIADSLLVVGVILLAFYILFYESIKDDKNKNDEHQIKHNENELKYK